MGYVIALTGGIGSGKSTVANAFSNLGIDVIDADIIARQIVAPNTLALRAIVARFGNSVLNHNGTLNRRVLRERIFTHPIEKNWLDILLHPLIYKEALKQMSLSKSPYLLWVVPLLVESLLTYKADRILVVNASIRTQLQRTIIRDNASRQHAERILNALATPEARLAVADDVIDNEGTFDTILLEVTSLHRSYITLAAQAKKLLDKLF